MRLRVVVFAAACVLGVACHRPDPYWGQVDGLYLQASQVFSGAFSNPTAESVSRLQALRDQIAPLPHPASADRYHQLLVQELDSGVAVLSATLAHDTARADQANLTLRQLQKEVDQERRRVGPR